MTKNKFFEYYPEPSEKYTIFLLQEDDLQNVTLYHLYSLIHIHISRPENQTDGSPNIKFIDSRTRNFQNTPFPLILDVH